MRFFVAFAISFLAFAGSANAAQPIKTALENVSGADAFHFTTKDDQLHSMDTAKIIESGAADPPYLAVYHSGETVYLASSTDLITWTERAVLSVGGTQPTLFKAGPTFIELDEHSDPTGTFCTGAGIGNVGSCIQAKYYSSLSNLLAGIPQIFTVILPRQFSVCNEGTPNVFNATGGNPPASVDIGFHYNSQCSNGTDREARGTLSPWASTGWSAVTNPGIDSALTTAGAAGNHGDRDYMVYADGCPYRLYEGQKIAGDFGSFREYLYSGTCGGTMTQLNPTTPHGSTAFSNPTFTHLTLPDGQPGVVATAFIQTANGGAGAGEGGELIYYFHDNPPASPCYGATNPDYQHVVWVWFENKDTSSISSSAAPNFTELASECGKPLHTRGIEHPSLPNYIAATSGSTQGFTSDPNPPNPPTITAENIFHQLNGDWRSYHEGMPGPCSYSSDSTYSGTTFRGSTGDYVKHHNPALYYSDLIGVCASNDLNLPQTLDLSKKFTFIAPNNCNNMHSCSVATGDAWLGPFMDEVFATPEWKAGNTLVIVTFDESGGSRPNAPTDHYTAVVGPSVPTGSTDSATYDHYSLLALTEDLLCLPRIGNAVGAATFATSFNLGGC